MFNNLVIEIEIGLSPLRIVTISSLYFVPSPLKVETNIKKIKFMSIDFNYRNDILIQILFHD